MVFDYLTEFITFSSVAEMDEHVTNHLERYRMILTENQAAIVQKIAAHALAYPGVSHLKAATIAGSLRISTKTVYRTVAKLAEFGIIEKVSTKKLNGIKGANIYRILPFVPSSMSERANGGETGSGTTPEPLPQNQSFLSFNLSQTSNLYSIYTNLQEERERKMAYLNEYQQMLYELLHEVPVQEELKDGLYQAIIASPMPDFRAFVQTRDALMGIIRDVQDGKLSINTTLRAVLHGAMKNRSYQEAPQPAITEPPRRKVAFYDWLTERE